MSLFPRLLILSLALIFTQPAHAELRISITQGQFTPLPIALPALTAADPSSAQMGQQIMQVVASDLERSGLFRPIDPNAYIQRFQFGEVMPRFPDWRQINAQALVNGSAVADGSNLRVSFRLWDVFAEQQLTGKEFNTVQSNWRRTAHLIADEIYKRLTGEDGYFDTRVVYVAESGPAKARVKRLAIMDQDGENHKFLTDGRNLVLTPRFSPNSQAVVYFSYVNNRPRVYLRDLQTGREEGLGTFDGMTFAPRFSPDGQRVIMSMAKNGNTDLYVMSLGSRDITRITNDPSIDTSPSFSPDASRIVFNSDRGGSQQLYVMNANGSGVQRISFGEGKYGTPVWSPRGDHIAFTKMHRGTFYIGVMKPDGSGERLLTQSWLDEGPTWAPNGRVLMFNRQSPSRGGRAGGSRLYFVDITGNVLREVITPTDASDPAWSPKLPL